MLEVFSHLSNSFWMRLLQTPSSLYVLPMKLLYTEWLNFFLGKVKIKWKHTSFPTIIAPCEKISADCSSDGHLLESQDELTDPDETNKVIPHHVLKRPLHLILNHTCGVVLYRRSWRTKQAIQLTRTKQFVYW